MNLRHAAALALVGWYLICHQWTSPPVDTSKKHHGAWRKLVEYDTFTKCENRRQDDLRSYLNHRGEYNIDDPKWLRSDAMLDSKMGGHLELLGRSMRICYKRTLQGAALRPTIRASRKSRMKPRHALDGWTVWRVLLPLKGVAVLGVLLAVIFGSFLATILRSQFSSPLCTSRSAQLGPTRARRISPTTVEKFVLRSCRLKEK